MARIGTQMHVVVAGLADCFVERFEGFETRGMRLGKIVQYGRQTCIEANPVLILSQISLLAQQAQPQRL
ncbi:hypothetical protein BA022_04615 [Diaphorobacter nitroreducens]|nr:hypothetical protein BA022_04615 [Diaphorobacter nitroreducens]